MINVLQIIAPITLGGAENVLLSINNRINKSHFRLHFCIFLNPKKSKNIFLERLNKAKCDVSIIYLDRLWFEFIYLFRLVKIIREKKD